MSALITLSCKDYCILTQALQPRNIPEPKQKWILRHISSCAPVNDIWGVVTAKCIAPLIQTTLLICGCFLRILVNILKQNQGLIIKTELSDAKVYSTKHLLKGHVL